MLGDDLGARQRRDDAEMRGDEIAASAMPSTGAADNSRAASRPGSPKQAITWAWQPSASPAWTSLSKPTAAMASS